MKMKVIDLLVDIANNGVSKEIKHFKYFHRINEEYDIGMINLSSIFYKLNNEIIDLNDEVEIIEDTPKEDKKIEKIGAYNIKKFCEDYPEMGRMIKDMYIKQDEIIDRLNGE